MENEIKVSVICTAYNHAKYIRKCLDGFVMQKTNFKYEVLINDDASTDNTAEIIKEYELKYPDIIKPIYQTENQYSKGVKISSDILSPRAKGKYIAFCEGDDYWCDENKLQLQYDAMEAHPECKMCVHKVQIISEDGCYCDKFYPPYKLAEKEIDGEEFLELTTSYSFQTSSYMFSIEEYKLLVQSKPEFYKASPVGDEAWVLFFANIGKVYYIDLVGSCYRRNSSSSWSSSMRNKDRQITAIERMIKTYELFNAYTDYKYNTSIEKRIQKRLFRKYLLIKEYKQLLTKELRQEFLARSFKERFKIRLCAKFPKVMKALKKF